MKIFKEINKQINGFLEVDLKQDVYLGHYPLEEFDSDDRIELGTWTPLGETLFEKIIGNKEFTFDIILPE